MKSLIMLLVLVANVAQAQTAPTDNFSIETVNGEVCRTKPGQPVRCLPSFKTLGLMSTDELELLNTLEGGFKVVASTGLSNAQVMKLGDSYRYLSIRNLATNPALIVVQNGQVRIPFFASVRWKGRGHMEGTLHIEGEIRAESQALKMSTTRFADSNTEQKIEVLRNLETAARHIHFRIAGTGGKSVDEATMDFLNDIVGPVILAETAANELPGLVVRKKILP